jgi:hypothetical protein
MIGASRFRQSLVGSYRFGDADREQPLSLEIWADRPSFLPKLAGGLIVEGEIDAPGLADRRPIAGRVTLEPWVPFASRYSLECAANDGRKLTLTAERRARARSPFWSASTVAGEIRDATDVMVARFELRLDYRQGLSRWLRR